VNQKPDTATFSDNIDKVPWYVAFGAAFALLCFLLWLAHFTIQHYLTTA
jgi:hypothetical protein